MAVGSFDVETEDEACAYLKCSQKQLRRWTAQGLIASFKVGRDRKYDIAELDRFLLACRIEARP